MISMQPTVLVILKIPHIAWLLGLVGWDAKSIQVATVWYLSSVSVWTAAFFAVSLPWLVLLLGWLVPLMLLE